MKALIIPAVIALIAAGIVVLVAVIFDVLDRAAVVPGSRMKHRAEK